MQALVLQILQFLAIVIPKLVTGASADEITSIISILSQAIPLAVELGEDLVQPIKNIITALQASGAVTTDQLNQLDTMEAQLDAAFDAAAAAAQAQDGTPASGT